MGEMPWEMIRYKLVILGAATVGKSSLVAHYTMGKELSYKETTLVASFSSIYLDKSVKLDTWEVAGQERWHELAHMYYKGAQAALIVYDVQNPESLHIAKEWIEELRQKLPKDLVIALAGNKVDLWDYSCINSEEVQDYALQNGFIFMETSAKTGQNISALFAAIGEELKTKQSQNSNFNSKPDVSSGCIIQ
ncbi:hypothetical protein ACLKA7_004227 [Drosophila subpalustris]